MKLRGYAAKLKDKEFLLFIFAGGLGTLTNLVVSSGLSFVLNPLLSYICGYVLSLFVAYWFNAAVVFKEKMSSAAFVKFVLSYLPNFAILFSFVFVFVELLNFYPIVAYGLAAMFGLPITFLLVRFFTFNKRGI